MKITVPRGTKDILPDEIHLWQWVEGKAKQLFQSYGYSEIRTPIFESSELFQRGIGELSDIVSKEMYTFTDRSERSLTLRPEGTASVARAYINHNLYRHQPKSKLFYCGPMFRYERPQAGRYRQFHQIGIENFGSSEPSTDAEAIAMAYTLFKSLGIKNLKIHLNTIGSISCRSNISKLVQNHLKSKNLSDLDEKFFQTLEKNPLRLLDNKSAKVQQFFEDLPDIKSTLSNEAQTRFENVCNFLQSLKIPFEVNSKLVRGLDYYSHTVFEIISDDLGAQNTVCGGGRYDNLIEELGGPKTPAFGFAFGMERLLSLIPSNKVSAKTNPIVYIAALDDNAYEVAFKLCQSIRSNNIHTIIEDQATSFNAAMKKATKQQATQFIAFSSDDLKNNQVKIKSLINKSSQIVTADTLQQSIETSI